LGCLRCGRLSQFLLVLRPVCRWFSPWYGSELCPESEEQVDEPSRPQ
jgi:hypothetical protein